jgi:hypothetical protein
MEFSVATIVSAVSLLPWLLYVLPVYQARGLADNLTWVPKTLHISLGLLSYGLLGEFPVSGKLRFLLAGAAALVNFILVLMFFRAAALVWPPRDSNDRRSAWFWVATLLFLTPLLLNLLFAMLERPALHWRFLIGIFPAYWLLLTFSTERAGRAGRVLLYGVVLPWVAINTGVAYAHTSAHSHPRQAAEIISAEQRPTDSVLASNLSIGNQLHWEINHRLGREVRIQVLRPPVAVARLSVLPAADLESLDLQNVDRLWVFYYKANLGTDRGQLSLSKHGFALGKEFPFNEPGLLLFVRQRPHE